MRGALLIAALLLGGCLVPSATRLDSLAAAADFDAAMLRVGTSGGEPTVGVTSAGTIFVTGYSTDLEAHVERSRDHGVTWESTAQTPIPRIDVDPYVYVDPLTDRVWSVPSWKTCSDILWSDDDGGSWQQSALLGRSGGCPLAGHDHQSLVAGVPPQGVTTTTYANVVYYTYNADRIGEGGTAFTRSTDGGQTWVMGANVFTADCQSGLAGVPATGPKGEVYLVKSGCDGLLVAASEDAGATWRHANITSVGIMGGGSALETRRALVPNPSVAVDAAGHVYAAWPGRDGLAYFASSTDQGRSWSAPTRATAPEVNATAFSALVAGDAGRIALAYLGTTANKTSWASNASHDAPDATVWHLYAALVTSADTASPRLFHARLTPSEDPVQVGCVRQGGGDERCRNLKDFIGITERDGRVFVAFADGCRKCTQAQQSNYADIEVAVLQDAPPLRGAATLGRFP